MKLIREILGRIFALWALIVFAPTLLLVLIPIMLTRLIPDPRGVEVFRKISKAWMRSFLTLIGCWLEVSGKEKIKGIGPAVVICNHNSLMDVPVTTPFIPWANKTIAKASMAKIPLFGIIYQRGSVLVDRTKESSRRDSYGKMKAVLDAGMHMCIYPEGTRNRTDQPLKTFHDGAFRLALETKKPLVPAVIFNTRKILPPGKPFYLMPHRLYMDFLDPIFPQPGDTIDSLKARAHEAMAAHYVAYRDER